ncbi:MAG: hypothetical protein ACD_75C00888G0001 [uncultured bacterium]|nr:MAG: hypothetical protein ACD_75C00888G0001 [uncultured bacterium]
MQKIVDELKQLIPFKDTTCAGDIVLIVAKEPKMLFYAHVNKIERDSTRRDEWWHVHFTLLAVPLQKLTWTLRTAQMSGKEIFTMGGEERFVKAVNLGEEGETRITSEKITKIAPLKRIK